MRPPGSPVTAGLDHDDGGEDAGAVAHRVLDVMEHVVAAQVTAVVDFHSEQRAWWPPWRPYDSTARRG